MLDVLKQVEEQAEENGQASPLIKECVRLNPPDEPPTQCAQDEAKRTEAAVRQIVAALDAAGTSATLDAIEAQVRRIESAVVIALEALGRRPPGRHTSCGIPAGCAQP